MSVQVEIDAPGNLVRATVRGTANLTRAGFEAFLDEMTAHADFRPGFHILYDRRSVTQSPDAEFVRAALGVIASRAGRMAGCRWAVVIGPQTALEVVRLTTLLGEQAGVEARPFFAPADALDWFWQADNAA
jgi:hypothetical protein